VKATTWADIDAGIAGASGTPSAMESRTPVAGGCINKCYRVAGSGRAYFVKVNSSGRRAMFEAEAAGLAEIAATATTRVPAPLCAGANAEAAWLVVEYIEFGEATTRSMAQLGEALAAQHRVTAGKFGWTRDNTIGSTPQLNPQNADWISFWRDCRLGYQLELASRNGAPAALLRKGERLAGGFAALFADRSVKPALLHGDLWGGNAGFDRTGTPVLFDPAVYYGDREADLAMTELFGGFSADFYAAYRAAFALDTGYEVRRQLYNLYHVLNHYNLFGGGYAAQAETLADRLLAEI
jgi:protein-ribulosamine 3-kinase